MNNHKPHGVLIPATLDTKADEVEFLRQALRREDIAVVVADCGTLGAPATAAEISRDEIARLAGTTIDELQEHADRATAIPTMIRGLEAVVRQMLDEGRIQGCLGVGGGTNAAFASAVFALLPHGMPKLLVSTVASGNTATFVGGRDVVLIHSVVDIMGLNSILRGILTQSARIMAAMLRAAPGEGDVCSSAGQSIGMSVFGATTKAAMAAMRRLNDMGHEVLAFHARGVGGRAMEGLVRDGRITSVLDLTITEIADFIVGGIMSAGPHRLEAAGDLGIPQVVLPGAIDMVNFGARDSLPEAYHRRKILAHTPHATLVRTTREENVSIAEYVAAKLNKARGPVEVILPQRGFSAYDCEGQPFFDPQADAAFCETLCANLSPSVPVHVIDSHINESECVDLAVDILEMHIRDRK